MNKICVGWSFYTDGAIGLHWTDVCMAWKRTSSSVVICQHNVVTRITHVYCCAYPTPAHFLIFVQIRFQCTTSFEHRSLFSCISYSIHNAAHTATCCSPSEFAHTTHILLASYHRASFRESCIFIGVTLRHRRVSSHSYHCVCVCALPPDSSFHQLWLHHCRCFAPPSGL